MAATVGTLAVIVMGSLIRGFQVRGGGQSIAKMVNARLVSRLDGEFTAVIFASFPTLNEAYNNLPDARSQMEHAWVIYKRFD